MTLRNFNMKGPLYLSTVGGTVCIDAKIVRNLTQYHVDGIRFLYQQCIQKEVNIVLNNDYGMNEERQICAFLSAIKRTAASLIICQHHNRCKWYYEFSLAGLKVVTADELVKDDSSEDSDVPDAVLLSHDQLKHIKTIPIDNWFFCIIQNLECLEKSRYIKNINSIYRIGIIDKNYLELTSDLQWFTMKWTNFALTEDKESFLKTYNLKKTNFLCPFPECWRRVTWETIKKFQPTQQEFQKYEETVENWCKENKPSLLSTVIPIKPRTASTRKRASTVKSTTIRTVKRRRGLSKQLKNLISESSESEEEILKKPIKTIESSDSDTQDINEDIQFFSKHDIKIGSNTVSSENTKIKIESNESVLDDTNESCILDSLFDNSKPSTSKNTQSKIKEEAESFETSSFNEEDDNYILNSLLDSPQPTSKKVEKESRISDKENESCPILDEPKSSETSTVNEEDNYILNSLIDSPKPASKKEEKKFRISDEENESCPILDLLFS